MPVMSRQSTFPRLSVKVIFCAGVVLNTETLISTVPAVVEHKVVPFDGVLGNGCPDTYSGIPPFTVTLSILTSNEMFVRICISQQFIVGVGVQVLVGLHVGVGVPVGSQVGVGVYVGLQLGVGVFVGAHVGDGVGVGKISVSVGVGVEVSVAVGVGVGVNS